MITLHHLLASRSFRIVWLLEEIAVPFELKQYARVDGRAPQEFKKLSPLGKSPVLTDGDLTLFESGAIVEYLVRKYARQMKPSEGEEKALLQYDYWMHDSEGSMMPFLWAVFFLDTGAQKTPFFMRFIIDLFVKGIRSQYLDPEIQSMFKYTDDHLAKNTYFAGDNLSGADIMMSFPLTVAYKRKGSEFEGKYLHIERWLRLIEGRPAYQAALAKVEDKDQFELNLPSH
ncbi:glutathione S-transferase Gst3 [Schizosaccharomyces japonicus yFS275]|uniref:glutathione transferase n=1 Tax=Schizosaccharomyces japonicus (strain yFS275 / FY16936) TaxID=402676 RepID=B6JXL7_SCHJY|nr:glutathione S-transferase Gst3 [Schizosaccharomyces japonicus yFS275]EEB05161.1 glutathione S-transferase Gst3 [Schizosaccharomyces japonicus yFS275]